MLCAWWPPTKRTLHCTLTWFVFFALDIAVEWECHFCIKRWRFCDFTFWFWFGILTDWILILRFFVFHLPQTTTKRTSLSKKLRCQGSFFVCVTRNVDVLFSFFLPRSLCLWQDKNNNELTFHRIAHFLCMNRTKTNREQEFQQSLQCSTLSLRQLPSIRKCAIKPCNRLVRKKWVRLKAIHKCIESILSWLYVTVPLINSRWMDLCICGGVLNEWQEQKSGIA